MSTNVAPTPPPSGEALGGDKGVPTLPPAPPTAAAAADDGPPPAAAPSLLCRWFRDGKLVTDIVGGGHVESTVEERRAMGKLLLLASSEWKRVLAPILAFAFVQEELIMLYRRCVGRVCTYIVWCGD